MSGGGFTRLPAGGVVVAVSVPHPRSAEPSGRARVLVHAANRQRALTRLRNLGLRSVYLRGNLHPPTPDEISAVLHHPDGLVWRSAPGGTTEFWHPIGALLRPAAA
ncbi:hypothetical protein [Streptomyces meridianus]|uniref:Uncharacterized protein n=1 Tax=Streptomyces meridianus TaxID=2938945 RepID=A0ABT0WZS4_9ACTN|nr:hypothetical protein [Streptomyces meridianus]MCM2575817.1 hypothetical protein [Streptomyces meridianus]